MTPFGLRKRLRAWLSPSQPERRPAPPPPHVPPEPEEDEEVEDLEVDSATLSEWLEAREVRVLDIREPRELQWGTAKGALCIPMNQVPQRLEEIPTDRTLIVVCAGGVRSYGVAHWLREQGFEHAWSLSEGIGGWPGERQPGPGGA